MNIELPATLTADIVLKISNEERLKPLWKRQNYHYDIILKFGNEEIHRWSAPQDANYVLTKLDLEEPDAYMGKDYVNEFVAERLKEIWFGEK